MGKKIVRLPKVASPNIAEVLDEFLAEQRNRLKPATLGKYEDVIDLFKSSMNGYACGCLDKGESALFERLYHAEGDAHREFCEIFGPDKILENVREFLDYFMIRKVMCGKELLRAAGTVMKKLARWLADHRGRQRLPHVTAERIVWPLWKRLGRAKGADLRRRECARGLLPAEGMQ
jgi:hypothetical protein